MHWLCYILLVTSLVQTVSTDSSEGSAGAAFPDDDLDEHNNYVEEEGVEGSGDSFSDDEDCPGNGCRKGKKNFGIILVRHAIIFQCTFFRSRACDEANSG